MELLLLGSTLSALATGLGALPIFFFKNITHRWRDILLALTAGIMVAAVTFSLIPTAFETSNFYTVSIGVLIGTIVLTILEKYIPHIDIGHNVKGISFDKKALLIIAAITLHNLPEGLSVGVSYASGDESLGPLIAFAIGVQNAPEGLLVALFLVKQNVSKLKAFIIATLTGAVEIITAIIGYFLMDYVSNLVPYGLAFAAGAMLYIVYKELIPESHGDGHATQATYSFIIGLLVMLLIIHLFE
ncbi:ZIP family metal transporter [Anaerobacillus sp. MEB173]|uniref:ZIP family metal transporter n=1 Tax=Anaerobacillus sp. MEB173 TaxID=3383345 RepID=UPI003F914852